MIAGLDHVNVRTAQLDAMIAWYGEVLGLNTGWRPNFPFGGAWLYAGDAPIIHLVAVVDAPTAPPSPEVQLEHAAFRASGLPDFLAKLDARGDRYELISLPDAGIVQVNIWDPDSNHLHVDFPLSELPDGQATSVM